MGYPDITGTAFVKMLLSVIYILSTCYFDVHVVVKQKVFSLQVTVNNLPTMAILYR